jgi:dienelactone hydrolase
LLKDKSEMTYPPHLFLVGTNDNLTTPLSIKKYISQLEEKGHTAEYWEHEGRPHAFLDSWKNQFLGTEFRKDAPPALDRMLEFMNNLFWD